MTRAYMYGQCDVGLGTLMEENHKPGSVLALLVAKRAEYTLIIFTVTIYVP